MASNDSRVAANVRPPLHPRVRQNIVPRVGKPEARGVGPRIPDGHARSAAEAGSQSPPRITGLPQQFAPHNSSVRPEGHRLCCVVDHRVWNVDRHTDDMDFVILDQDIKYTDDKRDAWSMLHAGLRLYSGVWSWELYGYNLTNEVVQYWGGAAEQVPKGSFSMPRTYGIRFAYNF